MKKLNKMTVKGLWLVAILAVSLGMTSCKKKPAEDVEGNYKGTISASVSGSSVETNDTEVTLKKESDDKVTVVIPAMSFGEGHNSIPEMNIAGVTVSKEKKGEYKLAETAIDIPAGNYNLKGTVNGTVKDEKLTLNASVKPGVMPMSIDIVFTTK